jgi:hypothetical protein
VDRNDTLMWIETIQPDVSKRCTGMGGNRHRGGDVRYPRSGNSDLGHPDSSTIQDGPSGSQYQNLSLGQSCAKLRLRCRSQK